MYKHVTRCWLINNGTKTLIAQGSSDGLNKVPVSKGRPTNPSRAIMVQIRFSSLHRWRECQGSMRRDRRAGHRAWWWGSWRHNQGWVYSCRSWEKKKSVSRWVERTRRIRIRDSRRWFLHRKEMLTVASVDPTICTHQVRARLFSGIVDGGHSPCWFEDKRLGHWRGLLDIKKSLLGIAFQL